MSANPDQMPHAVERTQPVTASPRGGQPLRLTLSPAAAAKQIVPFVAKGGAIRKHRLRDLGDLDKARAEKKAWIAACNDLLLKLFDGPAVAEACNDWVGRLLPEYAPLGLVVEQFYEEMDHRLRRLQAVVDHLEDMAVEETASPAPADAATPAVGGTQPPVRKDEARGSKSLNWARLFPTAEELAGRAPEPSPAPTPAKPAADGKPHAAPGTLMPVVKPVGLLLVQSAEDAKPICEFLTDLAVTPRVLAIADAKPGDPEALMAGATPPAFALVWPHGSDGQDAPASAAKFQFQLGFLVGRLGLSRVCLMQSIGKAANDGSPVPSITLAAHGGWQLPLARTLKRAGVAVDLNRLC